MFHRFLSTEKRNGGFFFFFVNISLLLRVIANNVSITRDRATIFPTSICIATKELKPGVVMLYVTQVSSSIVCGWTCKARKRDEWKG